MLTTVEKVIFLQQVDVFEHLATEDLAHLAAISEELFLAPENVLFVEGSYSDSMYLVLDGKVRLFKGSKDVMIAGKSDSFGTWALFDDQPRVVSAETIDETRLLRIDKEDFFDVLTDNVRVLQGILKSLVYRVRGLMNRVSKPALQ